MLIKLVSILKINQNVFCSLRNIFIKKSRVEFRYAYNLEFSFYREHKRTAIAVLFYKLLNKINIVNQIFFLFVY